MKRIICYILVTTFIFFSGCVEKKASTTTSASKKDYVVYNIGKTPDDLVMLDREDMREKDLLLNLFEGLVKVDDKGSIIPALSESWSITEDDTCYKFKIRDNAKWNDGSSITAEDFVNFFSLILSKESKNVYASELFCIYGAEEYNKGNVQFNNVAINARDNKTLEIKLNYPCNYLLNILSEPIYGLRKIDEKLFDWKKEYKNILYSGCFIIGDISNEKGVRLKNNNNYWNKASLSNLDIVVTFIESSEAAMAAFDNSKVDIFEGPPVSEIPNIIKRGNEIETSSLNCGVLAFNLAKENPASDIYLREALSVCIDRGYLVNEILNGGCRFSNTYVPYNISDGMNGVFSNKSFFKSTIEKEKAVELIKKSKIDKTPLKLIYEDKIENKKVCDNIAKNLKENLSIKVECEGYNKSQFYDELKKGDYNIAKIDLLCSYDYPLSFLERWQSGKNIYGYKNAQFDSFINKGRIDKDRVKKIENLRVCENILAEDIPFIPIYFSKSMICKRNNIDGIYATKKGNIKFDKVHIK